MFHEHPSDRTAAVEHAAIVTRAGPKLVALLGIIDECAEERRLQCLGVLLQAADEIFGDERGRLLRQEDIAVNEIEHFDGQVFEPLVTDQQDDRKLEAAAAHEVNERSGLALQAFFAPVDHHASDRRVGLYRDLCVLEPVRPDNLEARTLDLADNLIEADALEIIRIKGRCREQECETSEIIHTGLGSKLRDEYVGAFMTLR